MSPRSILPLVLLGGVFVMEGFDIAAMALAVPRLTDMGLDPAGFGWVFTALLVGLGAGGALLAPLGDRFGRRLLIVSGCGITGLATLATATAGSITEFLIWRLVTGLALGAALPNVSALSAELAPERLRATIMAVVSAGIPLGIAIAGLTAPEIIDLGNWPGLFVAPGAMALLLALMLQLILSGERPEKAEADPSKNRAKLPQLVLFSGLWIFPFAVFATMLALNALNLYLLNSWLPTVLPQAGMSLDAAARISGVVQLAGLAIGIGASLLLDRWHKGAALVLLFGAIALSFAAVFVTAPDPLVWTILLCVGVGGASAGGMVLPGLCAYLFPARLLSSAVGMGVLVARLGAFAGPPLGGWMLANEIPAQTFLGVAALPAIACAVVALMVPAALRRRERAEPNAPATP
ncbi:MFS transporter [Aurantiacibacter poecillastricola]|uniref:MFS transporter n=1 Tax=Aurantiacibacter poecillastricola TaxID=3064385 RepID=UPI00273D07F3|nr:MFS transporter [Aurantiacibacter sp. 219JJ12-13]MDP5260072.1 MFS transporter [Aurantiacibacter sp. 219JJ12-13]